MPLGSYQGTSPEELVQEAKEHLVQCGRCDAGLPQECVCSPKDPRSLIQAMSILLETYARCFPIKPLSRADEMMRHAEVEILYGDPDGDSCGGAAAYSGPCGGCTSCIHAQVSHYFHQEVEQAEVFRKAGLRWAPYVLNWSDFTDGLPGGKAPYCRSHSHLAECIKLKQEEMRYKNL